MGERFLIDTNIIIYLLDGVLPAGSINQISTIVQSETNISVITRIEVLGYPFDSKLNEERTNDFVSKCIVYELDNLVSNQTIKLRKEYKLKLPDAIIAATAIVHSFSWITRNEKDFGKISDLKVVNPFTL
ncbi:MAG: type II toxin-antitoxin system VapC family toxin [Bacteroidia bacterium]